jgi:alpha-ketoglutarate-dependent taurine dioxygenase
MTKSSGTILDRERRPEGRGAGTAPRTARQLSATPRSLVIEWDNGRRSEFSSLWLRDNCPGDRDRANGQRLVDIVDLPADPRIRTASIQADSVLVQWESEPEATLFDLDWLARHAPGELGFRAPELTNRLWLEGATLAASRDFAWNSFAEVRGNLATRLLWLTRLLQDGIAFLREVPREDSGVLDAASLIGHVAETNYGLVFDVRSVPQPENLAYSDLGLGLHTDNPYREPVPGFQILHVKMASDEGGESLFADGFAIAEHLRAADPESFRLLTRTAVPFLYRSKDAELYAERPFIQLSVDGAVVAVHYNSRSIAPMRLPADQTEAFYASYRVFARLLRDPRFQLKLHLSDGELVAFDNRRVLHGRTAFLSARYPRHLRGCYLTRDSVYSEAALLRRKLMEGSGK